MRIILTFCKADWELLHLCLFSGANHLSERWTHRMLQKHGARLVCVFTVDHIIYCLQVSFCKVRKGAVLHQITIKFWFVSFQLSTVWCDVNTVEIIVYFDCLGWTKKTFLNEQRKHTCMNLMALLSNVFQINAYLNKNLFNRFNKKDHISEISSHFFILFHKTLRNNTLNIC